VGNPQAILRARISARPFTTSTGFQQTCDEIGYAARAAGDEAFNGMGVPLSATEQPSAGSATAEVAMNTPESVEDLIPDEPLSSPGRTLDRVHAAIRGEFDADQLESDEERLFMDLFAQYLAQPNAENDAFVAKMYAEGGYVGEDEQGRLVRTLPGGGVEVIEPGS
jgi:hypothetical protein